MLNGVIVAFGAPRARSAYPVALLANGTKSFATRIAPEKLASLSSARYALMPALIVGASGPALPDVRQLVAKIRAASDEASPFTEIPSDARGVPHPLPARSRSPGTARPSGGSHKRGPAGR